MSWNSPPPDPTNPDLLDNLRQFLISQGLVRDPRDGTQQGRLPPLWIAPRFGVPAPGQTEGLNPVETDANLVVAINPATDVPPARYEGWLRYNHVTFVFRGRTPPPVLSLENSIRAVLNDKRGWMLSNVPVIESLLFRGLTPIGSDQFAFNYECEYSICIEGPFQPIS
jgi:hypothetical protein